MAFPTDPIDVEVGLFIDGAWVDAVGVGNGVRVEDGIQISRGRSSWSSQVDPSRATFTLDNRDGRWSPDYSGAAYAGFLKRNIPTRIGVGGATMHLFSEGLNDVVATTPDIAGTGGGSPTAPAFVDVTTDAETTSATTHTFNLPATVAVGNRLLLMVAAGHQSLTPKDQGAGVTDLDDWTLVDSGNLYTPWHAWAIYEIAATDSATATALAGSTVEFSTTAAVLSSSQVIRTSGARAGGQGAAWDYQGPAATAFSSAPNSPSLTASYGADEQRWYSIAFYGSGTDRVSAYPSSYTSISDSTSATNVLIATSHRTTSAATEDPGAYTLAGGENWQAMTFVYRAEEDASTDGALDIAGDIDLRIEVQLLEDPPDINAVGGADRIMLAQKTSGADGFNWILYRQGVALYMALIWDDTSGGFNWIDSVALPAEVRHDRMALRVTLDVNNGASGHDVAFYQSTAIGGTWTQIGTTITTSGTTDIKTNDATLYLAGRSAFGVSPSGPLVGRVYAFQMLDGIGGTAVTNPDFTAQTIGASSFNDAAGRTWTIGAGGTITDKRWRFHGELSSLPVRWNISGDDVIAPVEATGLFRRLRQGNRLLQSPMRRASIVNFEAFAPFGFDIQYWPLEEDRAFTSFGAAYGTAPFVISGTDVSPSSVDVFRGSKALPTLGTSSITATVDTYTEPTFGQWSVHWIQSVPADFIGDNFDYLRIDTTDMTWEVRYRDDSGGQLQVRARRGLTNVYASAWIAGANFTGAARRLWLDVEQSGANVDVRLVYQGQYDTTASLFSDAAAVAGSSGRATKITINQNADVPDWAFGHVSLHATGLSASYIQPALSGHDGEKAGDRVVRLCQEEGIAARIEGDTTESETMGPQQPGSLMDALQECQATDLGILSESADTLAISYRTRNSMRNQTAQAALDYSAGEVARSLELDRDDQGFANDIVLTNWSGATARASLDDGSDLSISEPPTGAGRYETSYTVNAQDARLPTIASNLLTLSTADEPRVSRLSVALHHSALVADATLTTDVLDMALGDLVTVANNLTVALGTTTVQQLVQGWTEQINPFEWTIDMLTSPASPWTTVTGPADPHSVSFRSQQSLAYSGSPPHVLTALGYTSTTPITRSADLDGILDDWVAGTGGTTHNVTSVATWTTACAAAVPGDLVRVTTGFDPGGALEIRGTRFGISAVGSNGRLTASPAGGSEGLPIIFTCADGVFIDDNNTSSNVGVVDPRNCQHVWLVGFNVRDGQFGIRCQNWGGSDGFPAYVAYCRAENIGDAAIIGQGWFQAIADSGGTPPAGTGNEHGYSTHFVFESNEVDGAGVRTGGQPGEGIYLGKGSAPGWVGYAEDAWVRGNDLTDWTSNGVDCKAGCHRVYITDNLIYVGHSNFGAPIETCYVDAAIDDRDGTLFDRDPQIWVEANRVYDNDLTNTDAGSTHIFGIMGISGIRWKNNVFWSKPETGAHPAIRARNEKGANDTEALAEFRNDPTEIINNTFWGDDSFDPAGYGTTPTTFPGTITFDLRNNIVDQASPATGEVDAAASDFIATVPAIGVAGTAEWSTYGPGSAFDLDPDSALVASGEDISDVTFLIDEDISQRTINKTNPNPGAFQQHPANE